jgi:hypothetical protein
MTGGDLEQLRSALGWAAFYWPSVKQETKPHFIARHEKLQRTLKAIIKDFEEYPDTRFAGFDADRTIVEVLRDIYFKIEPARSHSLATPVDDYVVAPLDVRSDRKTNLRAYLLRMVFNKVRAILSTGRAPNREVELLVGTVLGESIRAGTMTRLNKETRRKNTSSQK